MSSPGDPASYAPKSQQYAHELAAYKGRASSSRTGTRLLAILLVFLSDHRQCLAPAAGGSPINDRGRPEHQGTAPAHTRSQP